MQQIAMIKEELVTQGKWISPQEFNKARAAAVALCRCPHALPVASRRDPAPLRDFRRSLLSTRRCLAPKRPSCAATLAK